jgi:hypothetical protein
MLDEAPDGVLTREIGANECCERMSECCLADRSSQREWHTVHLLAHHQQCEEGTWS